jgi:hypothetical protein
MSNTLLNYFKKTENKTPLKPSNQNSNENIANDSKTLTPNRQTLQVKNENISSNKNLNGDSVKKEEKFKMTNCKKDKENEKADVMEVEDPDDEDEIIRPKKVRILN